MYVTSLARVLSTSDREEDIEPGGGEGKSRATRLESKKTKACMM